jgi:hypothetical protein
VCCSCAGIALPTCDWGLSFAVAVAVAVAVQLCVTWPCLVRRHQLSNTDTHMQISIVFLRQSSSLSHRRLDAMLSATMNSSTFISQRTGYFSSSWPKSQPRVYSPSRSSKPPCNQKQYRELSALYLAPHEITNILTCA